MAGKNCLVSTPEQHEKIFTDVARMLSEWEIGNELEGECARRIIDYFVANLSNSACASSRA
jgi:hypothetical protein